MSIKHIAIFSVVGMLLATTGCKNSIATKRQQHDADSLINIAYETKNYDRIALLADSLRETGGLSEGKAYYWLCYANDRSNKKRLAELYWTNGLAIMKDASTPEELELYAAIASRLTGLKCTWGQYEAALKVVVPALGHLKKHNANMTSDFINLLIYQGCCQSRFGLSGETVNNSLEEAYRAHLDNVKRNPNAIAYRDAFVGVINICYNFLEIKDYKKALYWIDCYGKLLEAYDKLPDARSDYSDKQRGRYYVYQATALEGVGRKREASKIYKKFMETSYSLTAEGLVVGSEYLRQAGLWKNAADNLRDTEIYIKDSGLDYSLQTIQEWMLKKFYVNMRAERVDTAKDVSMRIVEHLDSAITKQRLQDAIEEEAVHQKEAEMTAEKERMERQQWWTRLAVMAVFMIALIIYIIVRTRMAARLKKAHEQLKVAYDQLEETTAGHLDFCNAGHNPPVIGGGEHHGEFLDMIANAPIGIMPGLEFEGEEVDTIKGRPLFIYADGLNEAENLEKEQFGDDRLLDLLRKMSFSSARQVIEKLGAEVEAYRQGAEPNDDLTMMCLNIQ